MVDIARLAIEVDSRPANKAARDLDGLARSGKKTEKEVSTFSAKSSAAMAAFGVVVAGVATAAASMRSSLNFTTALAEVSTLVDETTFSMESLEATSKRLAQEFGTLPIEQTKAFYQVISAGASTAAEATEILTAANRLAVGGVTDVTTTADGLTSVLNAYGDQVDGATAVSDALFVGMRAGKTTIEELSSGLGKVAPIAASLNVSFDELTASVSALTKGGISTQESITGIRAVLAAVAKPTKEAADLSAELGIQFDAAGLQAKGFQGFLEDLAARTGGSTEKLAQLFGGVEALVPVMALSGQAGQDFADVMESMATKAGETETAFNKMADSPGFKIDRLMASINSIGLTLGGTLADVLAPAAEAVADALNRITGSSSVIQELSEIAKQEQKILDIQNELSREKTLRDFLNFDLIDLSGNTAKIHELEQRLEDARDDLEKMGVSAEEAAVAVGKVADEIIEIPVAAGVGGGSGGGGISSATKEIDKMRKSIFDLTNQFDPLARLNAELADLVRLRETGELREDIFDAAATESINRYVDTLETVTEETKEVDSVTQELGNTGRRVFDDISQFAIQGARSIQTAFADALLEGVNGFKSFADSALDIIKRLAANIASVKLLEGLGIGGLLGVGSSSAFAGGTNSVGGFTNAFGSGGGLINSFATSGIGQSLGLSQISQGPVSLPTLTGAGSAFTAGAGTVFSTAAAGALGIGIGSAIAGDSKVFGASGTMSSAIGAGIGAGAGAFFGSPALGAAIGGALGGVVNKLFGKGPLEKQEARLLGDVNALGFEGVVNTRFKAGGSVFGKGKTDNVILDTDSGDLLNSFKGLRESGISSKLLPFVDEAREQILQIGQILDTTIQGFNQNLRSTAEVLGLGTQSLDGFSRSIDLVSDKGEFLSEQQIAQVLSDVGDHMANVLLPGLQDMVRDGETAVTALNRLRGEFTSLEDALIVFGISAQDANAAISALSVATRTELVDAAGGIEALNGQITFFANNFLSAEEQLEIGFAKLDADMRALGLSANITVEEFKDLIISVTQAGGASVELASALLQLAPTFLNIKNAEAQLAAESQTTAPVVDNLAGSVDNLGNAAANTAVTIQASFARIDTARANLQAAEHQLAVAQSRSVLSSAQNELSAANSALSTAQSNLAAARSAEQSRVRADQSSVSDEINEIISQRSELISAYQQEASALESVVDRFGALSDKILDFKDSLAISSLSPFSPGEQLAIARQQFNVTRGLAAQGDEGALDRLPEVSRTFLEASQTFNGATGAFESDFNFVQQVLESSGATARATRDIASEQLLGIESTISQLEALNEESQRIVKSLNSGFSDVADSVLSVGQATAELAEAQAEFDDAQDAVRKANEDVETAVRDAGGFINDVESVTNAVEIAVRELGAAILQGFGNFAITDKQIVDFINANPLLTDPQIIQEAIKNGISASQLQRATGVSFERINTAAQGLSVRDDQIAAEVDRLLAQGVFIGIYNTARANGITSDRLAAESQLSREQINQFVNANGLQPFELGTDLITRTGPIFAHKGEGVTPSSVPGEIKKLREELAELRREQNQQMSALINTNIQANKENAQAIVKSNERLAVNANWQNRSRPKVA